VADAVDAEAVAVRDGVVYFASNGSGAVLAVPASGGSPRTIADGPADRGGDKPRILGLAADAHHLYWTDTARRAVLRVARDGGPPELLAPTGPEPYNIALDDDSVYWRDGTLDDGRVMAVAKRGGPARALVAGGESFPRGIAVDASGVYWTAGDPKAGRVERVGRDGTGRVTLARGQLGVHSIALDDGFAYFTAWGGGSVWKAAKPP
jgi:sugar lactone lactonase YvrE